jgi:uncharacterized protein YjbI with pentapeptide repeats
VKIFYSHTIAALLALAGSSALAGDNHPHRTITISGECRSCELASENLYGAEILGAVFVDADFSNTRLNHSVIVETRFINSTLGAADFSNARLSGVLFQESEMQSVNFRDVQGERLRFDGSELNNANFTNALMILANFMEADLSGAQLVSSRLFNVRFDGATLDRTDFTGVRMPRAGLRGADGQDAVFINADMRGADLTGAHLVRPDFTGAMLQGARFEGTILVDVRGLTADAVANACQDAEARLPEGLELVSCNEETRASSRPQERQTLRFSFSAEQSNGSAIGSGRSGNVVRLDVIQEEQARVLAEVEANRQALFLSRQAILEAQQAVRSATPLERREIERQVETEMQMMERLEEELEAQEEILVEQMRSNPDLLRLARESGERLIFVEDYRGDITHGHAGPSVIVDGNRYQLNGRYRWIYEVPVHDVLAAPEEPKMPANPEPASPAITVRDD